MINGIYFVIIRIVILYSFVIILVVDRRHISCLVSFELAIHLPVGIHLRDKDRTSDTVAQVNR